MKNKIANCGSKYVGEQENGKANGKGICKGPYESYEGDFVNGDRHGHGIITTERTIMEADFVNDKAEGSCTIKYQNGIVFEGEFKAGNPSGYGKITFSNGTFIDGEFKDGCIEHDGKSYSVSLFSVGVSEGDTTNGTGSYHELNSSWYKEGQFKDGELVSGKYCSYNGIIYEGNLDGGPHSNETVIIDRAGAKYEGEFKNWRSHGKGTVTYPDGFVFKTNNIENEEYFGVCVLVDENGNESRFYFEDKNKTGYGPYTYTKNEDKSLNGKPINGKCSLYFVNHTIFNGELVNGLREGYGVYITITEQKYMGDFKNGKFEGNGIFTIMSGFLGKYEGEFKNGLFHGKGEVIGSWEFYEGEFRYGEIVKGFGEGDLLFEKDNEGYFIRKPKENDIDNLEFVQFKGKRTKTFLGVSQEEGYFLDSIYYGNGSVKLSDGSVYEDEFIDKSLSGNGPYIWANIENAETNLISGEVSLTFANGSTYIGKMENGFKKSKSIFEKIFGIFHKNK